jgi:hypothetical protein
MSFKKNDILKILEKTGSWWKCELNGKSGLCPFNYLEPCNVPSELNGVLFLCNYYIYYSISKTCHTCSITT